MDDWLVSNFHATSTVVLKRWWCRVNLPSPALSCKYVKFVKRANSAIHGPMD